MRILLAEDDPMIGAAVEQGLRDDGFVVDWVRDGSAADGALRFRCAVPFDANPTGGLTVYGADTGRFPIGPTVVIEW